MKSITKFANYLISCHFFAVALPKLFRAADVFSPAAPMVCLVLADAADSLLYLLKQSTCYRCEYYVEQKR